MSIVKIIKPNGNSVIEDPKAINNFISQLEKIEDGKFVTSQPQHLPLHKPNNLIDQKFKNLKNGEYVKLGDKTLLQKVTIQ